jgi:hypothetical protein
MIGPTALKIIFMALVANLLAHSIQAAPENAPRQKTPPEFVMVNPDSVNDAKLAAWKKEGIAAVVLVLDERFDAAIYEAAAKAAAANGLDLYYWIEVGRNRKFATEHPEWVASLGMHDDWRKQFPKVRQLTKGEVAKAWPWTPIAYRDAFDAHIARIKSLLTRVPTDYRGLLLNDLQGGPSSCGCGNLQCRWAIDYNVPATTKKLGGHDVAAQFIAEIEPLAPGKQVIPVWTTECEEHDMALGKQPMRSWTTGYCGTVDCLGYCFARFSEQWNALQNAHHGTVALLALHKEFRRNRTEYGATAVWIKNAIRYVDRKELKPAASLWVVVQGFGVDAHEEKAARQAAAETGADAVLVARIPIDQSYEARIMSGASPDSSGEKSEHHHP